ncbi:hsp70-Hsp90 organizing protein 3-like [Papaver somniferum]|uniref:hsp70-Hsp90 organizing protein 3-like n=1 Tax=Papaver somniferum TaxID=3469 RepID=UPI000E6F4AA9|nr:hsp70-Hsp90 organizing protein 3-like [Papaver somniferum]
MAHLFPSMVVQLMKINYSFHVTVRTKASRRSSFSGDRQGVKILFPVTSPIPSYVDWSIDGVMKHVKSEKFTEKKSRIIVIDLHFRQMMIHKVKGIFPESKSRGTSAFRRKEYRLAAYWYTLALEIDPSDAAVLSNKNLCYVHLNNGKNALDDATECVLAKPNWPKAHYRKGVALKLLNRLDEAAESFSKGLKLDPENKELEAAFREVSLARLKSVSID